jgi:hypothetical protein
MSKHLIFLIVILFLVVGCDRGVIKEEEKFAAKVKATVNPDELQSWATNLIANANGFGGNSIRVSQTDVPKWVGLFYKDDGDFGEISIERRGVGDTNAFVQILYGGGFGHWGLAIGNPSLVLTNHDSCNNDLWKPGIYFWDCQ